MSSSYSIEPAQLWIDFVDKLRDLGHSLPGNYLDLALYAKDALYVLDPDNPHTDDWGVPATLLLGGSFEVIADGLQQLGHVESPRPEGE